MTGNTASRAAYVHVLRCFGDRSGCAVFGDDYAPMTIKTDDGSPLFQVPNPFGNDWGGVNKELYSVKPSSEFDSWLTIGTDSGNAQNKIR
eukprot:COSAG06_NODE_24_length_32981_cov_25.509671_24_plen_90_part_00